MDAPFEDLPVVAQKRITALKSAFANSRPVVDKHDLLGRFLEGIRKQFPAFNFAANPSAMDDWVVEQLRKNDDWVMDMADVLNEEGLETRRSALEAQLCSSIGKSLPDDFQFSQDEKAAAWHRAYDSAKSQAQTFNGKLPGWIQKARADWFKQHGSMKGLNRYALLALTKKYIKNFDVWHDDQVAVTEFAHEWRDETAAFWVMNAGTAEMEGLISPSSASDPATDSEIVCATFAGQWRPLDEALSLCPQHVNCVHFVSKTRIKEGTLPLFFGIGFSRYNTENLPSC